MGKYIKDDTKSLTIKGKVQLDFLKAILMENKKPTGMFSKSRLTFLRDAETKEKDTQAVLNELLEKYVKKDEEGNKVKETIKVKKTVDGGEVEEDQETDNFILEEETKEEYWKERAEALDGDIVFDILPSNINLYEEIKRFVINCPVELPTVSKTTENGNIDVTDVMYENLCKQFELL